MSDVGMIGLAVMGANLARNLESKGYSCVVFNRTNEVTERFLTVEAGKNFSGATSLKEFVEKLKRPRIVFIMVKAGAPVDAVLGELFTFLEPGDVILDGGNSFFKDTERRERECLARGLHFMGVGISGGEEGALKGPSLMPGGSPQAWELVSPILQKIAAQVEGPCTTYVGSGGSGHFVKMVHNGIEYADMQLIAESYDVLHRGAGIPLPRLAEVFAEWNKGPLSSFLIEITSTIFSFKDPLGQGLLLDQILDSAGQKGTGRWTVEAALDLGVAVPSIAASVDARLLSGSREARKALSDSYGAQLPTIQAAEDEIVKVVHDALLAGKVLAYSQGMDLLRVASDAYKWNLNLGEIASIWRGGCIIRARFLNDIRRAYDQDQSILHLLLSQTIREQVIAAIPALRRVVSWAIAAGIPVPSLGSSLSYFEALRSERLPQNLTQAQRDLFGAHTFERRDRPGSFHAHWE